MTAPRRCTTVAISNRKGGTGKTTLTVNLAAELARRGRLVLVADTDPQGHAGLGLGVKPAPGAPTIHDALAGRVSGLAGAVLPTVVPGVSLLPADVGHEGLAADSPPDRLARALAPLKPDFDCILIDTPPSVDGVLVNALAAADEVIVPVLPHTLAEQGLEQLNRLLFRILCQANERLRLAAVVPVMVESRVRLHRHVLERVANRVGRQRLLRGIRKDVALPEAFAAGRPVSAHAPRSRASLDFHLLAEEMAVAGIAGCAA